MSDEMRPARLWRNLPSDVRVAASTAFWTDEQAALEQAEGSRPHRAADQVPSEERGHPAGREEGQAPGGDGAGVGSAGGAAAGGVSPAASASDDGALSRRARHRARERPHHRRIALGAGRPRRSTRPRRRWRPSFPRPTCRAISGRCCGRIPRRGAARRAAGTERCEDVERSRALTDSMAPFERHIFICCNQREPGHPRGCCDPDADDWLQKAFKKALADARPESAHARQRAGLPRSVRARPDRGRLSRCACGTAA